MPPEPDWNVGTLLDWTVGYFNRKGCDSPRLDAEVLLAHSLKLKRIDLYARYNEVIGEAPKSAFRELVKKRAEGCPVAYLVGYKEFYGIRFLVNSNVLIPRPDTECLVDAALRIAKKENWKTILDIGTGSGCIAIVLAKLLPEVKVIAVDICSKALKVAEENARANKVSDRVHFLQSNLFASLQPNMVFNAIVSNPPYIPEPEIQKLEKDVKDFEPHLALGGGPDGFMVLDKIIEKAASVLNATGHLLLEIGSPQEQPSRERFQGHKEFQLNPTILDGARNPRVLHAFRVTT